METTKGVNAETEEEQYERQTAECMAAFKTQTYEELFKEAMRILGPVHPACRSANIEGLMRLYQSLDPYAYEGHPGYTYNHSDLTDQYPNWPDGPNAWESLEIRLRGLWYDWKDARAAFLALPPNSPETRDRLNDLANAEDALFKHDGFTLPPRVAAKYPSI